MSNWAEMCNFARMNCLKLTVFTFNCCCIVISITSVIHMQKHRRTQIHRRLRCSGTNVYKLLDFWVRFFDTGRERHTILNHSIQTKLKRSAHLVVFKISVDKDLLNSIVRLQFFNTLVLTQLQLLTWPKSTPMWTGANRVPNSTGLQ